MGTFQQACVQIPTRQGGARTNRLSLGLLVAFLATGVAGCSGGGGAGSAPSGEPAQVPPPPTQATGNVTIQVSDVLGAPVAGVVVKLYHQHGYVAAVSTDARGRAQVQEDLSDLYYIAASGNESRGGFSPPLPPVQETLDVSITVYPTSDPIGGIAGVSVPSGGVSDDGRSLEFRIRFVGSVGADYYMQSASVGPCTPRDDNDSPVFTADCIEGPLGFDATYTGTMLAVSRLSPKADGPALAVSLLMDQGSSVILHDPGERRLLAAKYLLTQLGANDQVVVSAFASDDLAARRPASLPNKPVTIYPVENPQFTTDGRDYFATIDSLPTLEGGASPLYDAVDRMIDFSAANAPTDARRVVLALSSGRDHRCNSRDECWNIENALVEKSAAAGVSVVVVGMGDRSGKIDTVALGMFAQGETGTVLWANDPRQVVTILGAMPAILDGRSPGVSATIRLESPVAGAFVSGRTVSGIAHFVLCPWDRDVPVDIPFAVRIP